MSWIKTISYAQAKGRLKTLYDRVKGPDDNIDNIMLAHSLRPHTMEGHMALYKYVLHHGGNTVPKWLLETIGVWVSLINDCAYCVEHHYAGLQRLLGDNERAEQILNALSAANIDAAPLTPAEKAALNYAETLTRTPGKIKQDAIENLRRHGFDDGQILEINQVTAYFSYANRTVLGLGVSTDGDILGLSPGSEQSDDWSHN
ncbi:MAG: peroxidase-related enzyme [Gammaproteobacteria bacterium]|nr:peroxidase-related enzyme [Gammaproteobacteria bacterium]